MIKNPNHQGRKRTMNPTHKFTLMLLALLLASLACQSLFPTTIAPGSFEERVAAGDLRLAGTGNVVYIGCQDPTAVVSLYLGPKTREINGAAYSVDVNPVTISVVTDGTQVRVEECQKSNQGEAYNWPAVGIYYPQDSKIVFTTCTQNEHRAEGSAFLVGEGFEGEYACYDKDDGGLMYEVALSAYGLGE